MSNNPGATGTPRAVSTPRVVVNMLLLSLLFPVALFLPAGRLDWANGWFCVAVIVGGSLLGRLLVARANPDLIAERADYASKQDVKPWDRVLMPFIAFGPFVIFLVAGLDVRFNGTAQMPPAIVVVGFAVLILGMAGSTWAMVANRFFAAVVRIQTDRGHTVVSSGPYRFVRHPGYATAMLGVIGIPFALGSWWALVPVLLLCALYVVRTALEDRTLQAELPGYAYYAERTRYRLLPGVW